MYRRPFYCAECHTNRWPGDCPHFPQTGPSAALIAEIRGKVPIKSEGHITDEQLLAMTRSGRRSIAAADDELAAIARAAGPFGRPGSYVLGFGPSEIAGGDVVRFTVESKIAFLPEKMIVPSFLGADLRIMDLKVDGASRFPGDMPACLFSENAFGARLGIGDVPAGTEFTIVVHNLANVPRMFSATIMGPRDTYPHISDEDLAHLAGAGMTDSIDPTVDTDDEADADDERKEDEEEDALEGDDDADLEEDDGEDSALDDDDDADIDDDDDDEKDREEERKDEEMESSPEEECGTGPVCASCPHTLSAHNKATTKCLSCGCDGFVFDGNDVIGSDIARMNNELVEDFNTGRKRTEAHLLAKLPTIINSLAGKPVFDVAPVRSVAPSSMYGDCEDRQPSVSPSLIMETMRLRKLARRLGDRRSALRAMPVVKKRFPLPFNEIEIPAYSTATVTARPQMMCRIRRLVCEQNSGLYLVDIKAGKNSCTLSYSGKGMPLELFRAFPKNLSEAQLSAIERSGFFENVPQETVQVSMDLTLVVYNDSDVAQKFRAVMLTDAIPDG